MNHEPRFHLNFDGKLSEGWGPPLSTTPIDVDPDYHQVTDHVETLDLDHMTDTIRAIAMAGATIISGEETPTRVDPDWVRRR